MYKLRFKRYIDVILALTGILIVLLPALIIIVVQLIVFNGKVFFVQERTGLNGGIFRIYKFRSLNPEEFQNKDLNTEDKPGAWGNFIRKTSLDEIPQFLNVLKGDLSMVGPRPLLPEYLPLYNNRERKRLMAKPGITGLAQIKGRNSLSWQHKFRYDNFYIDNQGFLFDIKILAKTFLVIILLNHNQTRIPEKFTGTPDSK